MLALGGKDDVLGFGRLCFKTLKDTKVEKAKVFRTLVRGLSANWMNEFRSLGEGVGWRRRLW